MATISGSPETSEGTLPADALSPDEVKANIERLNSEFTATLPRREYPTQGPMFFVTRAAQWIYQLGGGDLPTIVKRRALLPLDQDGQKRLYMVTADSPKSLINTIIQEALCFLLGQTVNVLEVMRP